MDIDLYARYVDKQGTLFVVIRRLARVKVGLAKFPRTRTLIPTTVDLLNVHAEKMSTLSAKKLQEYLDKGVLTRVITNQQIKP